jgi:hypothetical protein
MNTGRLIMKLQRAKAAIVRAEEAIEAAIGEIDVAPRAHKVRMGDALEGAFAQLREARAELFAVEAEIDRTDT